LQVAILLAPGIAPRSVESARKPLVAAGAVARLVGPRLGELAGLQVEATLETMPSVLFDAVVIPDGESVADELASLGQALEFLKDQYRHAKPICHLGSGITVLEEAGVPTDDDSDWAVVDGVEPFLEALARRRNWDRQVDPPPV
jgi:catalase